MNFYVTDTDVYEVDVISNVGTQTDAMYNYDVVVSL